MEPKDLRVTGGVVAGNPINFVVEGSAREVPTQFPDDDYKASVGRVHVNGQITVSLFRSLSGLRSCSRHTSLLPPPSRTRPGIHPHPHARTPSAMVYC